MVVELWKDLPFVKPWIETWKGFKEVRDCQNNGGTPRIEVDGDTRFECDYPEPFIREPTDEHNFPRPRIDDDNERETDDTNLPTPQPPPIPLPQPVSPPVVFNDDSPERRPRPIVPRTEPPSLAPNVPTRRLPNLEETGVRFGERKLQTVEDDALSRVYGCLLHSPITDSPAIFTICKRDTSQDNQAEEAIRFWEYLIRKIYDVTIEESLTGGCVLALNLIPGNFLKYSKPGQLFMTFGCSLLSEIATDFLEESKNAYQSVDGQGHINIKYVDCTNESEEEPPANRGLQPGFSGDISIDECFVPIRNFRNNEPEQLGMKTQLQILYEMTNEDGNRIQKQITIPSPLPLEEISTELILDTFPRFLFFGNVKFEFDVIPYGHVRMYVSESEADNGTIDDLATSIVDNLIQGFEKEQSRRKSFRVRNHIQGNFEISSAKYFLFNDEDGRPPLCGVFNLRTGSEQES